MKYLICSDIHGSAERTAVALEMMDKFGCDEMILLGDILYHGPRNPLPPGHNPQKVFELLNARSDKIIACRGNCDAEIDQMVLNFPIMSDYCLIVDGSRKLFVTHGHIWSSEHLPPLRRGDIFFSGHTHVQSLETNSDGIIICNPGSVSLPKDNAPAGFAVYNPESLALYDIAGIEVKRIFLTLFDV
jgi:putative phosphoesterase